MRRQLRQQLAQRPGVQHQIDIVTTEQRPQPAELEVARERGDRADTHYGAARARAALQHAHQLLAGAEDRVGVLEGDAARLREVDAPVVPLEERLPEALLQLAQLHRQRRGRDVQPCCGAREAALVGDGAEIAQVVVVQDGHAFDSI